jgi:Ca-activated chloride channel family protein
MQNRNVREREIEKRLTRVHSPEPPDDLLDRIRNDIPENLRPVEEQNGKVILKRGRSRQLLAASLFLAVVGGVVAYRVSQRVPEPVSGQRPTAPTSEVRQPLRVTTEVGPEARPAGADAPSAQSYPPGVTGDRDEKGGGQVASGSSELVDRKRDLSQSSREARPQLLQTQPTVEPARPIERGDEQEAPGKDSAELRSRVTREVGPAAAARKELERAPRSREVGSARIRESEIDLPETDLVFEIPDAPPAGESGRIRIAEGPPMALATEGKVARGSQSRSKKEIGDHLSEVERSRAPVVRPSTGGTAEPNDQPYGDMFFRAYGTNPFVDTEDDPLSTFGLDVDTGSYTLARSYLERGHLPPSEAIRVEEFINFFDYRDPAPRRGEFTMTAEGAPSPWARGPRYQLVRIGIRGREVPSADRQDATLIFVVDVSGSMARENRIGLVKRALHLLLDQLGTGDRVGLVSYGSRGQVLLEPSRNLPAVRRAIDRLTTGGSTNAEEGLLRGFELARRHYHAGGINRVILCSDGVANVGRTGPESILARIAHEAGEGIELTTVGFGMGNYNDVLMEQLADQGDGNYAYVDTLEEAHRVFVENLTATLQTIASDAKVQVEFDPRSVSRYRLLGYENRDVADHRFRDDTVDAGEIGAGHAVTALYEIKLAEDAPRRGSLGEVRLRYRSRATGRVVEDSLEIRRSLLARDWRSASASLQLASVAAEVAEILKGSFWAKEADVEGLRRRAEAVHQEFRGHPEVAELVDLVRRVCRKIEEGEGLEAPE